MSPLERRAWFPSILRTVTCQGALCVAVAAFFASPLRAECTGEDGGSSVVTEIREGETLILEDGRTVRLANLFTPKRSRHISSSDGRAQMEKMLAELISGKKVDLKLGEKKRDRYGRLLAQVTVANGDDRIWVQEQLVRVGLAQVVVAGDSRDCVRSLLDHERQAREEGRGLWKTGHFAIRQAAAEGILSGLMHRYEIVEGQVQNVAELKGRTYINFGHDWRQDFTAVVPAKSAALFAHNNGTSGFPGIELAKLKGRFIRVRGWIENFNGPAITVNQPEQIELVGNTPPAH